MTAPVSIGSIAADIIDFYPSIDLNDLIRVLKIALQEMFRNNGILSQFISDVTSLLVNSKHLQFLGRIWHKQKSLSIGERIAT